MIEIVSREDCYTDVLAKLEEYRAWGVPHIWVVDPWRRKLSGYKQAGLDSVTAFVVPALDVEIPAEQILPEE